MVLVDTSVWVDLFRDRSRASVRALDDALAGDDVALTRFTQLELLQGSRDDREWSRLSDYLGGQEYLEAGPATWEKAARVYFDLRRKGLSVRSPIDCCIAQIALDHDVLLLHRDRDFQVVGTVRALRQQRVDW